MLSVTFDAVFNICIFPPLIYLFDYPMHTFCLPSLSKKPFLFFWLFRFIVFLKIMLELLVVSQSENRNITDIVYCLIFLIFICFRILCFFLFRFIFWALSVFHCPKLGCMPERLYLFTFYPCVCCFLFCM